MKIDVIRLLIFTFLLVCSCSENDYEDAVTISGNIKGAENEHLFYTNPLKGTDMLLFKDSTKIDSVGNYKIEIPLAQITQITLQLPNTGRLSNNRLFRIIAEPNEKYIVNLPDSQSIGKNWFDVKSANNQVHYLINTFPQPLHPQETAGIYYQDSTASIIIEKTEKAFYRELSQLDSLMSRKEISKEVYDYIKKDREFYYTTQQATVGFVRFLMSERQPNIFNDDIKNMWSEALRKNLLNEPDFQRSMWGYYLAENKIIYENFKQSNFDLKKFNEKIKDSSYLKFRFNSIETHLPEAIQEFCKASYIKMELLQKDYQEELLHLYASFNSDFPRSPYLHYLKDDIHEVEAFQKRAKELFVPGIEFVANHDEIISFDSLLSEFNGQKLYVDIWGTWCGPCKQEFKHKDNLKRMLRKKEVVSLYICESRSSKREDWENMIKFYELEGYHVFASNELMSDIISKLGKKGSFYYPYYLLIDENGKVFKNEAARPSQLEALKKQIELF